MKNCLALFQVFYSMEQRAGEQILSHALHSRFMSQQLDEKKSSKITPLSKNKESIQALTR